MNENPYVSPALTAEELDTDDAPRNVRGPLVMLFLGPLMGAVIVGLAGAATAGLIVVPLALWDGELEAISNIAGAGGIFGGLGGAVIGLVMGVIAGVARPRFRKALIILTTIATVLLALACSLLLSAAMSFEFTSSWVLLNFGYALVLGGIGGTAGGATLGYVLGALAWGRPGKAGERPLTGGEESVCEGP